MENSGTVISDLKAAVHAQIPGNFDQLARESLGKNAALDQHIQSLVTFKDATIDCLVSQIDPEKIKTPTDFNMVARHLFLKFSRIIQTATT